MEVSIRVLNPDAFKRRVYTFRAAERNLSHQTNPATIREVKAEVDEMEREILNNYETLYLDWVLGGRASK
jgi:hypothetical protein